MNPMTNAEKLLFSTIKLTTSKGGEPLSGGTGFFFEFPLDETHTSVSIVTNKHVVKDCDAIEATCHVMNDTGDGITGEIVKVVLEINQKDIVFHPDVDTDLCAVSFVGILHNAIKGGKRIFFAPITPELIPTDAQWSNFDAIEELTMLGCPNGLYDEVNNIPLVRRGISATPIIANYNGKSEFVVDMACFPGSSGSPIFILDRNGHLDRKSNSYVLGGNRLFIVGILYAGPQITNTGNVILSQPPSVAVASMMHLGFAVKSTAMAALREGLVDRARLQDQRQAIS